MRAPWPEWSSGTRRLAERVVQPVVERAEPGEEADRRRRQDRDDRDRLPVHERVPAGPPAESEDEPEAEPEEERPSSTPRGSSPARQAAASPTRRRPVEVRGAARRRRARSSIRTPYLRLDQVLDEGVELRLRQESRTVFGMTLRRVTLRDVGVRVDDRLADELLERLARLLRASPASSSRSGPTVPVRFAGLKRVAAAAAVVVEDALARRPGRRSPFVASGASTQPRRRPAPSRSPASA